MRLTAMSIAALLALTLPALAEPTGAEVHANTLRAEAYIAAHPDWSPYPPGSKFAKDWIAQRKAAAAAAKKQ